MIGKYNKTPNKAFFFRGGCKFQGKGPIVNYVPEGGGGFQKSVVVQNWTPPKKIVR